MGACTFRTFWTSTESLEQAYADAVAHARQEHGYDSFNGSISTTSGVQPHPTVITPVSREAAVGATDSRMDHLNKWENCEAIPIAEPAAVQERVITVTVTVDGKGYQKYDQVQAAVLAAVRPHMQKNEMIADTEVGDWTTEQATTVNVAAGSGELRYYVERTENTGYRNTSTLNRDGYPTKNEARTAAKAAAAAETSEVTYKVKARREIDGDDALVTYTTTVVKSTAEVDVVLHSVAPGAKRVGWLFYGWASM